MNLKTATVSQYISMKPLTWDDYYEYIKEHKTVCIEDMEVPIGEKRSIKKYQPEEFELETTSVWSFPKRGDWATHKSKYRGNWAPQVVRNLILRYSKPGELVLDQMCGGGTTLIEAKLLNRKAIGVDINYEALMLAFNRLNFNTPFENQEGKDVHLYLGDARSLDLLGDNSVDLIATHPPYFNIISYSKKKRIQGDLSCANTLEEYLKGMHQVAKESFRVLKPGRYTAILIGDTRKKRHYVPIAFRVLEQFLDVGFILREDVIKVQWKTRKTGKKWAGLAKTAQECWVEKPKDDKYWTDFYLIAHEHLFIFRKPKEGESLNDYKESMKAF